MKTLFCLPLLFALTCHAQTMGLNAKISSAEPKTNAFVWVTCTTGTAVPAKTNTVMFMNATFYGYKAASATAAPTANTTNVYIGYKDTAGVVVAANSPAIFDLVSAGSWLALRTVGTKYDLSQFYFLGTTGDKVLIVYEQ